MPDLYSEPTSSARVLTAVYDDQHQTAERTPYQPVVSLEIEEPYDEEATANKYRKMVEKLTKYEIFNTSVEKIEEALEYASMSYLPANHYLAQR